MTNTISHLSQYEAFISSVTTQHTARSKFVRNNKVPMTPLVSSYYKEILRWSFLSQWFKYKLDLAFNNVKPQELVF